MTDHTESQVHLLEVARSPPGGSGLRAGEAAVDATRWSVGPEDFFVDDRIGDGS